MSAILDEKIEKAIRRIMKLEGETSFVVMEVKLLWEAIDARARNEKKERKHV